MWILFVSSMSAGRNLADGIPEKIIDDNFDAPYAQGYARSKFIAKLFC
jgi:hypothetical protein